ncbi:MAG: hypothetical protein IJS15_10420 [Victivallales bacterium]|nr:hypothetical protein [Victivallales bacterium]
MDYIVLCNGNIAVAVLPAQGGKITEMRFAGDVRNYIWFDERQAEKYDPAADYDPQFSGGIEELLPSDIPETIDGIVYPDHGELWRTPLNVVQSSSEQLHLAATLPATGFNYRREMLLDGNSLLCKTTITNIGEHTKHFLWKLHGAVSIAPGDTMHIPAKCMTAADVEWSTLPDILPRLFGGLITAPKDNGSSEFLYLTDLSGNFCEAHFADGHRLRCEFNGTFFTNIWYFGTYGKLNGSYTGILEPCTNYPASIKEAMSGGCCASLEPSESISTTVKWTLS